MKDLKPCPFCGGQPEDCDVSDYFVVCPSCCIEGPHSVDNSRAQAVECMPARLGVMGIEGKLMASIVASCC